MVVLLALTSFAAAADTVELKFAWPDDLKLGVTFERSDERRISGREPSTRTTRASFTMTADKDPQGYTITVSDRVVEPPAATPGEPFGPVMAAVLATMPSLRVFRDGSFERATDLAAARAPLLALIGKAEGATAASKAQAEGMISEAQIAQLGSEVWGSLVGAWVDARMTKGEAVAQEQQAPVPMLGVTVTMNVAYRYDGRVPCTDGATDAKCVALTLNSGLDDREVAAALTQRVGELSQNQGESAAGTKFTRLKMASEVRLVTHPDTLVPVRLVVERNNEMAGTERGVAFDSFQRDVRTWTFAAR